MVPLTDNLLRKLEAIDEHYATIEADLLNPEGLSDHRPLRNLSIKKSAMPSMIWTPTRTGSYPKKSLVHRQ